MCIYIHTPHTYPLPHSPRLSLLKCTNNPIIVPPNITLGQQPPLGAPTYHLQQTTPSRCPHMSPSANSPLSVPPHITFSQQPHHWLQRVVYSSSGEHDFQVTQAVFTCPVYIYTCGVCMQEHVYTCKTTDAVIRKQHKLCYRDQAGLH